MDWVMRSGGRIIDIVVWCWIGKVVSVGVLKWMIWCEFDDSDDDDVGWGEKFFWDCFGEIFFVVLYNVFVWFFFVVGFVFGYVKKLFVVMLVIYFFFGFFIIV